MGAAISACHAGGAWQQAWSLFREVQRRALELDAVCYTTAIKACENSGRWRHALSLLGEIWHAALELDKTTVAVLLSSCVRGLECKRTLLLLSELSTTSSMACAALPSSSFGQRRCSAGPAEQLSSRMLEAQV